jgi:hypothetical protein
MRIHEINNGLDSASEEEQIAAVQKNGRAINYIKNPSEAVQLAAVKQNAIVIQRIKNPSDAVQLAAVKNQPWALQYIKKTRNKTVILTAILGMIKSDEFDMKLYKEFRKKYPDWSEWAAIDQSLRTSRKIK